MAGKQQQHTNYNYIHQDSNLIPNSDKYTTPTITIFLKMSPLYSDTFQSMSDNFYSKQEALKIYEATNTPSDQRYEKTTQNID